MKRPGSARWLIFLAFLLSVLSGCLTFSTYRPLPAMKSDEGYGPMPWHLVDTWWDLGNDSPFDSLAVDVTISDDVPDSVNLYVAPIGMAHLSGTAFYGGLQTRMDGYTIKEPKERNLGPGFLFSMWGEHGNDAIRTSDGGCMHTSGQWGEYVSARRPFAWKKGKYTYRLTRTNRQVLPGKVCTWVSAFVYSHEKNATVYIGALRFKGDKLILERKMANFVQLYGQRRPVGDIPKLKVTFGPPVVNGAPVQDATANAVYPERVPDYADVTALNGSLVVTVGQRVEKRGTRQVALIEAKK